MLLPAPPFSQDSQKWFDLEDTDWLKVVTGSVETDRELLILEQIEAGADRVAALVERELLTTKTVYVSGFAQGGCVALYAALTRVRCAGVVSMGGPPVRLDLLKGKLRFPATPVRLVCGAADEAFPLADLKAVATGLAETVPDARLDVGPGGRHDVGPAEVQALLAAVESCAGAAQ